MYQKRNQSIQFVGCIQCSSWIHLMCQKCTSALNVRLKCKAHIEIYSLVKLAKYHKVWKGFVHNLKSIEMLCYWNQCIVERKRTDEMIDWADLFERFSATCKTSKKFKVNFLLRKNYHDWQQTLYFNWIREISMLAEYGVNIVETLCYAFTKLTYHKDETKRIECLKK